MNRLGVSVIIPTYNRGRIVEAAIRSALAAVRPGDEIIVVDDGSTDDTRERLDVFAGRIRYVPSAHVGPGAIRNIGIREASRPLVAFLDSDDQWLPDKLDLQRIVMEEHPDVLFSFSDFGHRRRDGSEVHHFLSTWHRDPREWSEILPTSFLFSSLAPLPPGRQDFRVHVGYLYSTSMRGDYVCTSTVMARREESGNALRFAEDLWRYQDWVCFAQLARVGAAAYLDCETQWNCDHSGSRLTRGSQLYSRSARIEVLTRVWGSDPVFLEEYGHRYREVLGEHRRRKARTLLALGRTKEAREELRLAGSASLLERALASLPAPLVRLVVRSRRALQRKSPAGSRAGNGNEMRGAGAPENEPPEPRPRSERRPSKVGQTLTTRAARMAGFRAAELMAARVDECRRLDRLPRAFTVRPITANDYRRLQAFLDLKKIDKLRSSNDIGLVAEAEGAIRAMTWVRFGPAEYTWDLAELGVILQIPPRYCWLHNGRAADEGLVGPWAMIMGRLPAWLLERGVDTVCLQVASDNLYSIRCHESLGFRKVGRVIAFRIAGLALLRLHIGKRKRLMFGRRLLALDQFFV